MLNKQHIILLILLSSFNLNAQSIRILPEEYQISFPNLNDLEKAYVYKDVLLREECRSLKNGNREEFMNYLRCQKKDTLINSETGETYFRRVIDTIQLKKGKYLYRYKEGVNIYFTVNQNHEIHGEISSKIKRNEKNYTTKGLYKNGFLIHLNIYNQGKLISRDTINLKDSVTISEKYRENGQLKSKLIKHIKTDLYINSHYDKNGLLERFEDKLKGIIEIYDYLNDENTPENHYKTTYQYKKGDKECRESYDGETGLIDFKKCESKKEVRVYYYNEKGKLERSGAYNKETGVSKDYDANGKEKQVNYPKNN